MGKFERMKCVLALESRKLTSLKWKICMFWKYKKYTVWIFLVAEIGKKVRKK